MSYSIQFSPQADDHLARLTARQRSIVIAAIEAQLKYEPSQQTRNRKQMKPNQLAGWELRVGQLRVYYDVDSTPDRIVRVNAVGRKVRNRVFLGDEETKLHEND